MVPVKAGPFLILTSMPQREVVTSLLNRSELRCCFSLCSNGIEQLNPAGSTLPNIKEP